MNLNTNLYLTPRLRTSKAILLLPLHAFKPWTQATLPYLLSGAARFTSYTVAQVSSQQFAAQHGGFGNSSKIAGAFAKVGKNDYYLRHVRPYISGRLSLDGFPSDLILETFFKICRENPKFVKIGQEYRAGTLHDDVSRFTVAGDINRHHSTADMQLNNVADMHCCILSLSCNTVHTITFPWQQCLRERATMPCCT